HGRRDGHARPRSGASGALPRDRAPGGSAGVRLRGGRAPRPGGDAVNLTIREALLAFRRAPLLSALSVTTIAFSLFVVGLFGLVDDVRFGRDWVEKLDRLRQVAAAVGLVVGAAFAVVAIIIIGTTIRMAVLQRSREIAIMRLVGATNGFIRRPFLLQGAIKGMLG